MLPASCPLTPFVCTTYASHAIWRREYLAVILGSLVFPISIQTRDCCWPRITLTGVVTLTVASVYIMMQFLCLKECLDILITTEPNFINFCDIDNEPNSNTEWGLSMYLVVA